MKRITLLFLLITFELFSQSKKKQILIPFRDKNQWGLCDTLGNIKVKPFADDVLSFSAGRKFGGKYVIRKNDKISVVNQNMEVLLEDSKYDALETHGEYDEIAIYKKSNMGIFKNEKELIPPIYSRVKITENSSYIVQNEHLKGVINSKGEIIVPVKYEDVYASWKEEDIKDPKFIWIAQGGEKKEKFYDEKVKIEPDDSSTALYTQEGVDGTRIRKYNDSIKAVLLKKYDEVEISGNNLASVRKSGKYGIVQTQDTKEIITPLYDKQLNYVADDKKLKAFIGIKDGKYGMILENNMIKVPFVYDMIKEASGNFYYLEKNNKKGLVILNGVYPIIPAKYNRLRIESPISVNNHWQFGIFKVENENGKTGYVGENGVEYFKD